MAPQRDWFTNDYYKILGVSDKATDKEIAAPTASSPRSTTRTPTPAPRSTFKEISAAYDVLGDPEKRKEYDEVRRLGPSDLGGFGGGGRRWRRDFNFRVDDLRTSSAACSAGRGRRRRADARQRAPARADVEAELHLSFQDAVDGVVTTVNVASEARCSTCGGSGSRPGIGSRHLPPLQRDRACSTTTRACSRCPRHARSAAAGGHHRRSRARPATARGSSSATARSRCGSPPAWRTASASGSRAAARPGGQGGPAGDLYVVVHVAPHPLFGRKGRNLTLTVPVTFPEAALGTTITVPTLDEPVTLKVPAGTRRAGPSG